MNRTKLSVTQKDFELCKESSLKDILNEKSFTDVTLACNDDKQVDAHRIILGSQSLFFKRILKVNDRRDILVYLPNVSSDDLEPILQFIYLGQAEIGEQELEKFLMFGKMFEITGLMDLQFNPASEPDIAKKIMETGYEGDGVLINKSLLKRQPNGKYPCDQCDYQSVHKRSVRRHQDAVHLGIKHSCDECPKEYCDPYELKCHKQSAHEGVFYQCEQCNKTFPAHRTLLQHEREHQGINTKCTQCEKSFKNVTSLNYHVTKEHDGLKHVCDLCGFRTNRIFRLKEHKGTVHTTSKMTEKAQ
jgi:hypothetical protein